MKKRKNHDCPACGQDRRLPPDAYDLFVKMDRNLERLFGNSRKLHADIDMAWNDLPPDCEWGTK